MLCQCVVLLVCGLALAAHAEGPKGVPDLSNSTAVTAATEPVSVYTRPDGTGQPLSACYAVGATIMDATITLTVLDANMDPVYLYPAPDMWLETSNGGLTLCPGGSIADSDTDPNGETTFSNPIYGGGQSNYFGGELTQVMINGAALLDPGLPIQFLSPDINGDLIVNLSDIIEFHDDYVAGGHSNRSDFYWDLQLNLFDWIIVAQGIGAECP